MIPHQTPTPSLEGDVSLKTSSVSEDIADKKIKSNRFQGLLSLKQFLSPYKGLMIIVLISLIIASLSTLAIPIAFRRVIDDGFGGNDPLSIAETFAWLLVVAGILACATASRYASIALLGECVIQDIRQTLYRHILKFDPAITDKRKPNDLLMRLTGDTLIIQDVVGSGISVLLRNVLLLGGGLTMMFLTAPLLGAMTLLIIPLVLVPAITLGRRVKGLSKKAQEQLDALNNQAEEVFQGLMTVQSFVAEKTMESIFTTGQATLLSISKKRILERGFLTLILIFLIFSSIVGIMWMGVSSVSSGGLTGGALAQFVLYAVFTAGAAASLSEASASLQKANLAMERIAEVLNQYPEIENGRLLFTEPDSGDIIFDHVSFWYSSRPDALVLNDISFTLKAGEKVALVGASGSGKTTILNLLMGFRAPSSGQIFMGRKNQKDISLHSLRSEISYVSQDAVIFDGTLEENLRLAWQKAEDFDLLQALSEADLMDLLEKLPLGLKTPLGSRGIKLSGGQKQRIAIARAFLKNSPILLLDEATSALDSTTEKKVKMALDHLMRGRTSLIIAHRFSSVLDADRILVLDQGRIVEDGTHTELMALKAHYYRLASQQFQIFEVE
jgi:ATP-binding cassette, subfamily B, bacterial